MSNYRQIHTKIWKDAWFLDLDSDLKLLFIYLFSNDRANLAGLYDVSPRVIAFETDLPPDRIQAGIDLFAAEGKAFYDDGWFWIPNLLRYNAQNITSPKIQKHLKDTVAAIPDIPLKQQWIAHYNGMVDSEYRIPVPDTVSIGYDTVYIPDPTEQEQEQEQDHEQEQDQDPEIAATAAPSPPAAPRETEGVRQFRELFGAKRYKNNVQKDAILDLEKKYGTGALLEAGRWAAKKGMTVSHAVGAVESALPKWGNGKDKARASPSKANEPKSWAGIREWMEQEGVEWQAEGQ